MEEAITEAVDIWNLALSDLTDDAAVGIPLRIAIVSPGTEMVRARWVPIGNYYGGGWQEDKFSKYVGFFRRTGGEILFDSNLLPGLTHAKKIHFALHELGHMLGLSHLRCTQCLGLMRCYIGDDNVVTDIDPGGVEYHALEQMYGNQTNSQCQLNRKWGFGYRWDLVKGAVTFTKAQWDGCIRTCGVNASSEPASVESAGLVSTVVASGIEYRLFMSEGGADWKELARLTQAEWPEDTLSMQFVEGLDAAYFALQVLDGGTVISEAIPGSGVRMPPLTPMAILPKEDVNLNGVAGHVALPACVSLEMKNNSNDPFDWVGQSDQPWLTLATSGGTVAGAAQVPIQVCLTSDVNNLPVGVNRGTIRFTDVIRNVTVSRTVSITLEAGVQPPELRVTPEDSLLAIGVQGGPFTPACQLYRLGNVGGADLQWAAESISPWLTVSAPGGTLGPGLETTVSVCINSNAAALDPGVYVGGTEFRNTTVGISNTRFARLNVVSQCSDADRDGWTTCAGDCNDANPDIHPGAPEVCDGLDNDCNGRIDDGPFPCSSGPSTTVRWDAATGRLPIDMPCPWTEVNNTATEPQIQNGLLTIATTAPTTNNTYYIQAREQLSIPADSLVLQFRVRFVSGASSTTWRGPISIAIESTPEYGTDVFIGDGEMFYLSGNLTRGGTAAVATGDALHTYRVVVAGTELRIYQDGVLQLHGSVFHGQAGDGFFTGYPRIIWGEGSLDAYGTSEWEYFQHNAGLPIGGPNLVRWSANGHCYEAVYGPGLTWQQALDQCKNRCGYLATITSSEEECLIEGLFENNPAFWYVDGFGNALGPWTGGYQAPTAPEPGGGWGWFNGEPFTYTNWSSHDPDNCCGLNQNRIEFIRDGNAPPTRWTDVEHLAGFVRGYIFESNDCSSSTPVISTPIACIPCTDADGDGLTTCAGDCDDTNARVHPGALELCDGKDNDCDGIVDNTPFACGATCDTLVTQPFTSVPGAKAIAFSRGGAYGRYMYVLSGYHDIYRVDSTGVASLFGHTRLDSRGNAVALVFDDTPQRRYGGVLYAIIDNTGDPGPNSGGIDRVFPDGTSEVFVNGPNTGSLRWPLLGCWDAIIDDVGRFGYDMFVSDFEVDDYGSPSTLLRVSPTGVVSTFDGGGIRGPMGVDLDRLGKFGGDLLVANPNAGPPWWNGADNQVYRVRPDGTRATAIPDRGLGLPTDVIVDALGRFDGGVFVNYGGATIVLYDSTGAAVARGVPGATDISLRQDRWGAFGYDLFAIVPGCNGGEIRRVVCGQRGCVDEDQDGWTVCAGDCDDNDPAVHPGALEVCDGKDNDCNGKVDDTPFACNDLAACDSLVSEVFTSEVPDPPAIAFSPGGAYGDYMYVANGTEIWRVAPNGHAERFAARRPVGNGALQDIFFDTTPDQRYCGNLFMVLDYYGGPCYAGIDRVLPDGTVVPFVDGCPGNPVLLGAAGLVIDDVGRFGRSMYLADFEVDEAGRSPSTLIRIRPDGGREPFDNVMLRGISGVDLDHLGGFGGDLLATNTANREWRQGDNAVYRIAPDGTRTVVVPDAGLGLAVDVLADGLGRLGGHALVLYEEASQLLEYDAQGVIHHRIQMPGGVTEIGDRLGQDRYGHFGYGLYCTAPNLNEVRRITCYRTLNSAPVAVDDAVSTPEDVPLYLGASALLRNDSDLDGTPLTITSVLNGTNGTVALNDTTVTFVPASEGNCAGSFEYIVHDPIGAADTARVFVEVIPQNDQPEPQPDTLTTLAGHSLTVEACALLSNDTDRDSVCAIVGTTCGASPPDLVPLCLAGCDTLQVVGVRVLEDTHGTADLGGTTVLYTPIGGFEGRARFEYRVADGHGGLANGLVVVDVRPERPGNHPPDCSEAAANPAVLWPPDHRLVPIEITGVRDLDGDPVSVRTLRVTSNESTDAVGDGATCPDAFVNGMSLSLRAERSGRGQGRVYVIHFQASDAAGGVCEDSVAVCVPHDQGANSPGSEDGLAAFDAMSCGQRRSPPLASEPAVAGQMRYALLGVTPSPSKGVVAVRFSVPGTGDARVEMLDISGRRVMARDIGSIDAGEHLALVGDSSMPAGVYVVRLTWAGRILTRRAVVVR